MIGDIHENVKRLKKPALYSGFDCRLSGIKGLLCFPSQLSRDGIHPQFESLSLFFSSSILLDES